MQGLTFSTDAAKKDITTEDTVEVPLNGDIYFAYRPSTNMIAEFYVAFGSENVSITLAGVKKFLQKVLEPEAWHLLQTGVNNDSLDWGELAKLAKDIIAEFSANPPTPSSGSTSSRAATGNASTASSRRPASTRATSTRRASAT